MIDGLTLIGESINDSVPSTRALFAAGDLAAVAALARDQAERGAHFIDVNVGTRAPDFFAECVRAVQERTDRPLCLDSPDPELLAAGLKAYDPDRAGGAKPLVNSLAETRPALLDLARIQPFRLVLMASERLEAGGAKPNKTGADTHATARRLFALARKAGLAPDELWVDPSIAPVGADLEGLTGAALEAIELIHGDRELAGVHLVVGLSNFTAMLPAKRKDGSPVRPPLQNAFLTLAVPRGLDTIIGSAKRDYRLLAPGDAALAALERALAAPGLEALQHIQQFYAG